MKGEMMDRETKRLDFRPTDSESRQRAKDSGVFIAPIGSFAYHVRLTDRPDSTDHQHHCELLIDHDHYRGRCDCDGWKYHEGACAHLWAVHEAERQNIVDVTSIREATTNTGPCPVCKRGEPYRGDGQ